MYVYPCLQYISVSLSACLSLSLSPPPSLYLSLPVYVSDTSGVTRVLDRAVNPMLKIFKQVFRFLNLIFCTALLGVACNLPSVQTIY